MIDIIVSDFISKISAEIKKPDNLCILEKECINPIIHILASKFYPYFAILFFMYFIMLVILISTLFVVFTRFNNSSDIIPNSFSTHI